MTPLLFVHLAPRFATQWERLASAADRLLQERETRLPAAVEAAKIAPDVAAARMTTARALAELWRRVLTSDELPWPLDWSDELGASLPQLLDDLAQAAPRARSIDVDHGDALAAISWLLQPIGEGSLPHLWIAADHARFVADRASERRAA